MTDNKELKTGNSRKPISLHGLSFRQALAALLAVKPPKEKPQDESKETKKPSS